MKSASKVGCKEAGELISEFLDNALAPETQKSLLKHFQDCKPCVGFLETYKKTPGLCRGALLKNMPREMGDRLMSFLRGKRTPGG